MKVDIDQVGWQAANIPIVQDISLNLQPGSLTAIVGPNGSGKTTLLHLVGGLRRPSQGQIHYDGQPATSLRPRDRARQVALLEQHPDTSLDLSVRQVVELGRLPHIGRWPGAKDPAAKVVSDAMRRADVTHLADRSWTSLSGGERQRTQLARALAQQPRLLLLDEPTNHLDLRHQLSLLEMVAGLTTQGITAVAVLHDLDLAAAFCPRVVVLAAGRVAAAGSTAEVLTSDLIAEIFEVRANVCRTDRLRVSWSRTSAPR